MVQNSMEILAPAGDWDMLRAAVFSGADCVYIGVEGFNARRSAANFGGADLQQATAFCHARGCKVYAAMNTLVLPGQEDAVFKTLKLIEEAGCDAVIVQDIGVAQVALAATSLVVHGSTQMSVHSLAGVQQLAEMGFSRAILARELEEKEIEEIARHSPIELEVFVHGALCVSVSGQCSMSAFLGGRSANRGACAGTCRLPFYAKMEENHLAQAEDSFSPAGDGSHHLSLKDLSVLQALPRLAQMGVVSAKIEGRLRGPEYTAVVVDSARKILSGQPYDEGLLQDVFSRSGFTDGWFAGKPEKEMFGFRTGQDSAAGKAAQPKARELYRREMPRVPVSFLLTLTENGAKLLVDDGMYKVEEILEQTLSSAQKDPAPALQTALLKTGGTPFYALPESCIIEASGLFLPASAAGDLRRKALEKLLYLREHPVKKQSEVIGFGFGLAFGGEKADLEAVEQRKQQRQEKGSPFLRARFEKIDQVPQNALEFCEEIILPIAQWEQIPTEWRHKTRLWLPRAMFGGEEAKVQKLVDASKNQGFAGYEAQNIAHWYLCKGLPVASGAGLNIANANSVITAALYSNDGLTLSPELTLRQMKGIAQHQDIQKGVFLDALCYGHLPVMLTRACPLKNVTTCARCLKEGKLVDRKGKAFPVFCHGQVRSIHNAVPLWMGDRLPDIPTDTATMVFTMETKKEAAGIIRAYHNGETAPSAFTRGLYDRGLAD